MNKYSNKLFTTPEQTSKLIELGLPEPISISEIITPIYDGVCIATQGETKASEVVYIRNYTIGEILSFLPPYLGGWQLLMHFNTHYDYWSVYYLSDGSSDDKYLRLNAHGGQLIDALFRLVIILKEDGLI